MKRIDIDETIRLHNKWRRQFLNAFAGGDYADMPLSEHRCCQLGKALRELDANPGNTLTCQQLLDEDARFHALADEIVDLSRNGLGDAADLLLPELNEACHQLVAGLDAFRQQQENDCPG